VAATKRPFLKEDRVGLRIALVLAACCTLAPLGGRGSGIVAALPAASTMISYAGKGSPPKIYRVAGLWLVLSTDKDGDGVYHAVLTIRGPGARVFKAQGPRNTDGNAKFGVARLDPGVTTPQIVFTSFTGGAHCCIQVDILSFDGLRWRQIDAGASNGGILSLFDKDGSGVPTLVFGDDRFLYAFAPYAESRSPIRVFNFEAGKLIDVSGAWRYKPLYLAEMTKMRGECEQHANSACAAYVADAARAGRFKEAWAVMLASYDRTSQVFPASCGVAEVQGSCPDGHEHKFPSYPEALAWFLAATGYKSK
jgi:hypothetical protein